MLLFRGWDFFAVKSPCITPALGENTDMCISITFYSLASYYISLITGSPPFPLTVEQILIVLFYFTIFPRWSPNKLIDLYMSHYDVIYFQGNGLDNHMCKHGKNDINSFKITCLEYNCVLYDCWKQLILEKYV